MKECVYILTRRFLVTSFNLFSGDSINALRFFRAFSYDGKLRLGLAICKMSGGGGGGLT